MKFHIIIDHPKRNSFNHAIMQSFIEGLKTNHHDFDILDLAEKAIESGSSAELEMILYGAVKEGIHHRLEEVMHLKEHAGQ